MASDRPEMARSLAAELAQMGDALTGRRATLREMIGLLGTHAYQLIIVVCVLPFLLPVSVPGMSPPFGLAVAVIAFQLAFGRLPWLPGRLLDHPLPPGFLTKVLAVTQRVVGMVERAVRPQWPAVTGTRGLVAVHYLLMAAAALALALPAPIPLTNTFPGWTILLLAVGLMERDGLFVLAGYAMALVTAAWFFLVGAAVHQAFMATWRWMGG